MSNFNKYFVCVDCKFPHYDETENFCRNCGRENGCKHMVLKTETLRKGNFITNRCFATQYSTIDGTIVYTTESWSYREI